MRQIRSYFFTPKMSADRLEGAASDPPSSSALSARFALTVPTMPFGLGSPMASGADFLKTTANGSTAGSIFVSIHAGGEKGLKRPLQKSPKLSPRKPLV